MKSRFLKPIVFIAAAILLSPNCEEPEPAKEDTFVQTFGGSGIDFALSVQQTSDGGYIIAGSTESYGAGSKDVWLIKTDAARDTIWTKTFGGSAWDDGVSVQQTSDGGYVITGAIEFYGVSWKDVCLIKTDASGDMVWTKTFGGSGAEMGTSVQQTTDGGYILTGFTAPYGEGSEDAWLIKTDASGDTVWAKTFGGSEREWGVSVQQTADVGYILTGFTQSYGAGSMDVWLIKMDASGDTVWTKTFGGSGADMGTSVQQTTDGGYIIAGSTESYGAGSDDVWLIKTEASGDTVWTKTFGGSAGDGGSSVQQTTDGGYIIAGGTESYGAGDVDVWLIKTDASGDSEWTKTFGGSDYDGGQSIQQTFDRGYIIAGETESYGAGKTDALLIKTDEDGNAE